MGSRSCAPRGAGPARVGEAPGSRWARRGEELIEATPRSAASGAAPPSEVGPAAATAGRSATAGSPVPASSSSHQLPWPAPASCSASQRSSSATAAFRSSNSHGRRSSTGVSSNAPTRVSSSARSEGSKLLSSHSWLCSRHAGPVSPAADHWVSLPSSSPRRSRTAGTWPVGGSVQCGMSGTTAVGSDSLRTSEPGSSGSPPLRPDGAERPASSSWPSAAEASGARP